jgi:hypothetical protein
MCPWSHSQPIKNFLNLETAEVGLGADKKKLVIIPSADHNDILFVGLKEYFEALQQFIEKTDDSP